MHLTVLDTVIIILSGSSRIKISTLEQLKLKPW